MWDKNIKLKQNDFCIKTGFLETQRCVVAYLIPICFMCFV